MIFNDNMTEYLKPITEIIVVLIVPIKVIYFEH